jgi:hypothetical protein
MDSLPTHYVSSPPIPPMTSNKHIGTWTHQTNSQLKRKTHIPKECHIAIAKNLSYPKNFNILFLRQNESFKFYVHLFSRQNGLNYKTFT